MAKNTDRSQHRVIEQAPRPGRRVVILLVDDHEDTLVLTQLMLERRGHQVLTARDVSSALEVAERERVELLISDIGLPDDSGLVLLEKLRARQAIVGIALSGFGREADVQRSKDAGFAEHLTKPVDLQRLHEAIHRLVSEAPHE